MPIYTMQAPNGKTYDIEGPEGASEEDVRAEILRRDPAAGQVSAPVEEEAGLGRSFGLGTRNVLEGAGGIVDIIGGPANALVNTVAGTSLSTTPVRDLGSYVADQLGLANAENDTERLIGKGVEYGTQGLLTAGAGNLIKGAQGTTGLIGTALAETPIRDVAAGVGAGLAEEGTRQAGGNEALQILASLGGGVGTYAGLSALPKSLDAAKMSMQQIKDFFLSKGYNISDEEAARAYEYYARGGDEAAAVKDPAQEAPTPTTAAAPVEPAQLDLNLGTPAHQLEMDFNRPTLEQRLASEAADFRRSRALEPTAEQVFARPEQQLEMDLRQGPDQGAFDFTTEQPQAAPRTQQNVIDELADEFSIKDVDKALTERDFRAQVNAQLASEGMPQLPKKVAITDEYVPSKLEQDVANHADALAKDWSNAPEVSVYDHFDDAGEGIDKNALGVYDPESGQVLLNSKMIEKEAARREISIQEMTNTVLFHEGLGHYGLAQKFRGDLDGTLHNWYQTSPNFRQRVNDWINKHADDYADEDQIARAAEEVLAEMSEKGRIPAKLVDKIKNLIKTSARKLGFEWDVSMREIKTVLDQAHAAVINGKKADVFGNGVRSMKSSFGDSEGALQGRAAKEEGERTTLNRVRSNRNIEDILDEAAPVKEGQTHEEWINDAGRIKNVGKVAQSLAKGAEPAELLAAEEYAVRSANRIFDLSRKAANETLSPRELHILEREQNRLKNVLQSIDDVKANAGRILNAAKIEVGSDKALTDTMRRMLANADLSTEEGRAAANAAINKAKISEARKKVLRNINNAISNIANLPFAMMSTLDLSAPFRQGRSLAHTKQFWKSMVPMIKMAAKSDNFKAYMAEIQSRPTFKLMEDSGLFLADVGKQLSRREERFMSSWASKLPGFGRAVRFSERGYVGFLNKLRADTFDDLLRKSKDAGFDYAQDPESLKKLSSFVNAATGRGNIPGGGDRFGPILNGLFFSPRLMASRVKLLNPVTYATLPPVVRKEAIKSLLATGGTSLAAGYLASLAGANLELDPRSSDFMKIKTGDTRYDTLGGFGQYVTLGARLFSNEKKNAKGDIVELGKKFGSDTRWDVSMDFLSNKFSPLASLVRDWMKGKDFAGQPIDMKKETIKRFIPLFAQDVYDAYQQEGLVGAAKAAPGFVGFGAQTYAAPSGTDVYGRSYEGERVDTPEITEIKRLEELEGNTIVNPPRKKVGDKTLTEEEFNQYQELAGQYIVQDLQQEMQSEDWQYYTDEEKIDLIKQIARDQRTNAREELFGNAED